MRLRYRLLNVFARPGQPFSGNPLCVFEDGTGLAEEQMLALARQFNLSETTFLVDPVDGADAGVRIFTTAYEMPFAGHPTLGTAHVARALGRGGDRLGLSMPVGVIPVEADGDAWTLTANAGRIEADLDTDDLAAALQLPAGTVLPPAQQVSVGTSQVMARVADADAVARARAVPAAFTDYAGMGRSGGEALVYVWAEVAPGKVVARALISDGRLVEEDPATGSACSNLGAHLAAQGRSGSWTVSQGEQVARPSTLHLDVDAAGTVRVGGLVRELGTGTVEL
jgi:trans-2,3-dihydro-3-hydroxyanthranilate isomerase